MANKILQLEIDEEAYRDMRDYVAFAKMAGHDVGALWEFGYLVCAAIEKGDDSLKIEPKKKPKRKRKRKT